LEIPAFPKHGVVDETDWGSLLATASPQGSRRPVERDIGFVDKEAIWIRRDFGIFLEELASFPRFDGKLVW
jgi:hypothetical protein